MPLPTPSQGRARSFDGCGPTEMALLYERQWAEAHHGHEPQSPTRDVTAIQFSVHTHDSSSQRDCFQRGRDHERDGGEQQHYGQAIEGSSRSLFVAAH